MAERAMPTIDDFPSNANGEKKPVRKDETKPVVKGKVTKKTSVFRRVKDEFVQEDAPTVGGYILYDILLPALRDLISDIGHGAIDVAMGNDNRSYRRSSSRSRGSYISYDRYYDDRDRRRRDRDDERYATRRRNRDLDDIIFEDRSDAEDVLDRMCDYLEKYDDVPVSYFYDLCGETVPGDFTKDDWGWTNLSQAQVRRAGHRGYYIDFPKIRPI